MNSPLQQEKDGFNTSKKDNERYAACPAPQEVKDSGTGLVGQVVKFQRRFKWHNSCAHTGIYRVCDFKNPFSEYFSDLISHASHLGGVTFTMRGNEQWSWSKGGVEEVKESGSRGWSRWEFKRLLFIGSDDCVQTNLDNVASQLRRECARAALCRGKTCHGVTTPVLMPRSFKRSNQNRNRNRIVDHKTDFNFW